MVGLLCSHTTNNWDSLKRGGSWSGRLVHIRVHLTAFTAAPKELNRQTQEYMFEKSYCKRSQLQLELIKSNLWDWPFWSWLADSLPAGLTDLITHWGTFKVKQQTKTQYSAVLNLLQSHSLKSLNRQSATLQTDLLTWTSEDTLPAWVGVKQRAERVLSVSPCKAAN